MLTAEDGEQALQVSRKFPTTIHLLLSDVLMPKLGGMTLREQTLRERPAIKVLLLSVIVGTAPRRGGVPPQAVPSRDFERQRPTFIARRLARLVRPGGLGRTRSRAGAYAGE